MTRVVRARASDTTVTRPTTSTNEFDETVETTTDHTERLWLFEPRETEAEQIAGERINGSLGGLAAADGSTDLDQGDRVSHGGIDYELDTVVGHPEDDEPDGTTSPETDFWIASFTRRN